MGRCSEIEEEASDEAQALNASPPCILFSFFALLYHNYDPLVIHRLPRLDSKPTHWAPLIYQARWQLAGQHTGEGDRNVKERCQKVLAKVLAI
ncbi:hypothetical protein Moror_16906 [Moniliophthora roreri MCA 2997]|uniref:Uncharacterized protein n=1 Tax=Moniliophthora roreri (strain MCA 2997) TaxID=1381753 RepID=V2YDD1_MONRO|nr:hypothetical protein Moror_16906 [Moniliophthora roreri MCA 2997]